LADWLGATSAVIIVGASLAGVRAAESLRRSGFRGKLTLVGAEEHFPPFDRPPMSKELLQGAWDADRARLRVDDMDCQFRLGVQATGLDLSRGVELDDGHALPFDGLVVATGASPRMIPGAAGLGGIHTLRTFEDCVSLRAEIAPGVRVVVVGAGWIGMELAASCIALGAHVTVVEQLDTPLQTTVGIEIGHWVAALHARNGVNFRFRSRVSNFVGEKCVEAVELADGDLLPAEVVVIAVGVTPATDWLRGSGLTIRDGLVLDEYCRAVGSERVTAAGDVARWHNPLFNREMRIEHWTSAVEQASAAAANLLVGPEGGHPVSLMPYVWSNQYEVKLQYAGIVGRFAGVVEGSLDDGRFVAIFTDVDDHFREDMVVGALCVNAPARLLKYKRAIAQGLRVASARTLLADARP
jgi:NADPH-dependent 2,4-dienoyl-CoA reductase/sulfur reductase-like enzyme